MRLIRRFLRPRPLRVAIISTPRSGNTWLRAMLGEACELPTVAAHRPKDIDWRSLPERCLVQLHWPPTRDLQRTLREHGFRTVTIARHPFDVLISILHFCNHEPQTSHWLDGLGGNENSLRGVDPLSPAFLNYCTGPRSDALLSVSREWWQTRGVIRTKYEDLVSDPEREMIRILEQLQYPAIAVSRAIDAARFDRLQAQNDNRHYWQGIPNLWHKLLTSPHAKTLAAAHGATLKQYEYSAAADDALNDEQAARNWEVYSSAANN